MSSANCSCGLLAARFLQVSPAGTIPLTPPASAFNGDGCTVTAAGGAGKVTFTASAANGANITTELLPQPNGYRTKGFQVFAARR